VQRDNVGVRLGYLLEDGNLVPDLETIRLAVWIGADRLKKEIYHVLSALHELLVDHFAGIVGTGLDVNRLLYDCVRATTQGLSGPVLRTRE